MTTGEKIAALRRELGLSQEALGEKLGLSRQAVSKWEADQAVPGMDNLVELARLFGVPVDTLLRPDEPLPGKSEQSEEQNPPETVSIDDCSDPHMPEWTRKMRWIIWGVAGLLCASVVCNVVSLVWLSQLQNQVNWIPNGGTVYVPAPTESDSAEFVDSDVSCSYDGEQLTFDIRVTPRTFDESETAKISLRSEELAVTGDAKVTDGSYQCSVSIPLADTVSLTLMLTKDGITRNLPIQEYTDLKREYQMEVLIPSTAVWSEGQLFLKSASVEVIPAMQDSVLSNWPVSGYATLYIEGKDVSGPVPLEGFEQFDQIGMDGMLWDSDAFHYTTLTCSFGSEKYPCSEYDSYEVRVTLTDNFGHVQEYTQR